MTKIFKQLARHWAVCLVVFALLFVQAYCDLSLPDYTSRIVDTGIQQGGIESPLPETIRQSTLDALTLLMSEEDADALQHAYGYYLQDDGVLKLRTDLTDDERAEVEAQETAETEEAPAEEPAAEKTAENEETIEEEPVHLRGETKICPVCKAEVDGDAMFCNHCGAQL